jgi:hypothetical protein
METPVLLRVLGKRINVNEFIDAKIAPTNSLVAMRRQDMSICLLTLTRGMEGLIPDFAIHDVVGLVIGGCFDAITFSKNWLRCLIL